MMKQRGQELELHNLELQQLHPELEQELNSKLKLGNRLNSKLKLIVN
jgi:hypothetical protein